MGPGPGSVTGASVVADAQQYLGVPYQWGGTNPQTGLDCSGLVQRVYGDLGISLPRTSQEQATVGTPVDTIADAQPGDLVFFEPGAGGPGHVGIYIGNGQMIDAPHTGTDVQVQSVGDPSAIRRILPASGAPTLSSTALPGGIPSSLDVPAGLVAAVPVGVGHLGRARVAPGRRGQAGVGLQRRRRQLGRGAGPDAVDAVDRRRSRGERPRSDPGRRRRRPAPRQLPPAATTGRSPWPWPPTTPVRGPWPSTAASRPTPRPPTT